MNAAFELESTLTARYQTTVPNEVRRALKLHKHDKIRYTVQPDGQVLITRVAPSEENDPALGKFLSFLMHDIAAYPQRLRSIDPDLVKRIQSLVQDVKIDLDAELSADDE
jgi:antitoxin PrlF